jgi:hypothetical protein
MSRSLESKQSLSGLQRTRQSTREAAAGEGKVRQCRRLYSGWRPRRVGKRGHAGRLSSEVRVRRAQLRERATAVGYGTAG